MSDADAKDAERQAAREMTEHGLDVQRDAWMPYAVVREGRGGRWLLESKHQRDGLWYRAVLHLPCGGRVKGLWARDVAGALEWCDAIAACGPEDP